MKPIVKVLGTSLLQKAKIRIQEVAESMRFKMFPLNIFAMIM